MKKTYMQPLAEVEQAEAEGFVCGSVRGVVSDSEDAIDFGGVDEEGVKDPSARRSEWGEW